MEAAYIKRDRIWDIYGHLPSDQRWSWKDADNSEVICIGVDEKVVGCADVGMWREIS